MIYKFLLLCAMALLLTACLHTHSHAALKAKDSITSSVEAWNPNPLDGDIILPMPCGLGMVFKLVAVPAKGFLWDMPARLGRDDTQHAERAYYDSRFSSALSGPFALEDLPPAWRVYVPPKGNYYYYLIGKYEVTALQWRALMDNACPVEQQEGQAGGQVPLTPPLSAADALPKINVSWYDAVDFSRKYTEWLLKHHPDTLPRFAGDSRNVGFLRLPTEAEWEYAARGGQYSPSAWLAQEDFFEMTDGTNYIDYAVFRPEGAARIEESPLRVGSRKPNPLGLYDTAGNVAEMVMDVFRFSLGGRLHGSAGGFVRKGGSYVSDQAQIMPGRREEVAFFQNNGPVQSRDLGFRLTLSGINTPAGDRPAALLQEWQKAGENYAQLLDTTRNPLEELDRLLPLASSDADRNNLQYLRGVLKDNSIALERQQAMSAESLVRTAVYIIETVRNIAIRRKGIEGQLALMERDKKSAEAKKSSYNFDATIKKAREGVVTMTKALNETANFYRTKIDDSRQLNPQILDAAFAQVEKDSDKQDEFNANLRKNLDLYRQHVLLLRKGQKIDKDTIIKNIVPASLR